jgi:hypothetical protein
MKKAFFMLLAVALPVLIIAGNGSASGTAIAKIVHEPEQKKVKFVDDKGKVQKEISLKSVKTNVKLQDKRLRREWDGEQEVVKQPAIAKSGKFLVIEKTVIERFLPTEEFLKEYQGVGDMAVGGSITLYDSHGNALFEKEFPKGRAVIGGAHSAFVVSDNGTAVAVITGGKDPERENILHVYQSSGVEILTYPKKEGEGAYPDQIMQISPNGRYLAVKVGFENELSKPVFFDLEKGSFWKADRMYVVREIADEGVVKASYRDQSDKKAVFTELNLKNLLGGE